jgi:hypothetical protein
MRFYGAEHNNIERGKNLKMIKKIKISKIKKSQNFMIKFQNSKILYDLKILKW